MSNCSCQHGLYGFLFSAPDPMRSCLLSKCSMAGVRDKAPTSLFHCTRSAVTRWAIRTANTRNGSLPFPIGSSGRTFHRVRGVRGGQGSSVGLHLLALALGGHAVPCWCLVLGPTGPVGTGCFGLKYTCRGWGGFQPRKISAAPNSGGALCTVSVNFGTAKSWGTVVPGGEKI